MSIPVAGMSDPALRRALRKTKTAILPIGSLEQHGPHLPVSTDSVITEHVAGMIAERITAFVLPVIYYGVSFEHKPMFNVSVRNSVLSGMVSDSCVSLAEYGIRRIILLNGHHGNMGALQYIAQETRGRVPADTHVHPLHYWHALDGEFDHAGIVETSLMLAVAPDLVSMDKAAPNSRRLPKSKIAYGAMTSKPGSFPEITGNGVWGDPRKATAAKGRQLLEQIVSVMSKTIAEIQE